jgi:hypothetical protein
VTEPQVLRDALQQLPPASLGGKDPAPVAPEMLDKAAAFLLRCGAARGSPLAQSGPTFALAVETVCPVTRVVSTSFL